MTTFLVLGLLEASSFAQEPAPAPEPAPASEPAPTAEPAPAPTGGGTATMMPDQIAIGVHVGPSIGVTGLGVGLLPRLEVGFMPASLRERLMIFVTGAWSAPGAKGTVSDDRVGGGSYDWTLRQDQIQLGAGAAWRFSEETAKVHPEASLAPQVYFLTTHADGTADGQAFGETTESYANWGLVAAGGVGYDLGPGRLMGRLELAFSPLKGDITGKGSTTAIAPTVGYRVMF
jgi:hypothetical protein